MGWGPRARESLGPRIGAKGVREWYEHQHYSSATALPGGASKLKPRDTAAHAAAHAAAATCSLHDSPRRHAVAAAAAATAATTTATTASVPRHAPPRRCKQRVALRPPRRRRRGRLGLQVDDDRQRRSAESRGRRDRSEVRAAESQQLQQPAVYHPTALL